MRRLGFMSKDANRRDEFTNVVRSQQLLQVGSKPGTTCGHMQVQRALVITCVACSVFRQSTVRRTLQSKGRTRSTSKQVSESARPTTERARLVGAGPLNAHGSAHANMR